jgi:hypothetical protein
MKQHPMTLFYRNSYVAHGLRKILCCLPFVLLACSNLDDAAPEQRNSFVYFYGSDQNMISVAAAMDADGIVTVGYKTQSLTDLTNPTMVLMKTDLYGKTQWQKEYPKLYGKAIKPITDGYLVAADSIITVTDPTTQAVSYSYSSKFYKMDTQGNTVYKYSTAASTFNFFSNAINTDDQGNAYLIGTIVRGVNNKSAFVARFKPAASGYALDWFQDFDLLTKNYTNGRSVQVSSTGSIIWPSSVQATLQGRSYTAFPLVKPGGTFENIGLFGETDDTNNFIVNDLIPSALGFAAIGTQYTLSGNNPTGTNFFFVMLDKQGRAQPTSTKYFDGGAEVALGQGTSDVEDSGVTITASADGGFLLAGYLNSTPTRGNGGKDVLIIKVDGFGSFQWTRSYGGSGDEVVNSAMKTADGGYLLSGTSTVQNFSSMFIMKLDSNGELKN